MIRGIRPFALSNVDRRLTIVLAAAAFLCWTSPAAAEGPFAEAIEYAQARTVKVFGAEIGRNEGYATGIVVSPEGHILVASGIYLAGERLRVVLPDGSMHRATLLRRSVPIQTAVLKIEAETPEFFELPQKLPVRKGDWVLAVSNAFKVADGPEKLSVNVGVVSLLTPLDVKRGTQDVPYDAEALLIDAITSNPGAPGGAVITADGRLAGMIGKVIESQDTGTRLNYAVPSHLLARFLAGRPLDAGSEELASGKPGELGIRLFTLGGRNSPAYIDRVVRGSPAAEAGLRPDDLILAVGGERVRNIGDYRRLADSLVAGREVELLIKRKQKVIRVSVTPAAKE